LSDKDFKVKNKLQVKGITSAGPLVSDVSGNIDSTPYIATQYGGTGTTTSPTSGQILYSASGATYTPTTLSSLVQGAKYQADAPSSPAVGDIWIESDSTSDAFDPNLLRRQAFTATAGQTVFTTSISFVDGYEQVYFNGMLLLKNSDYAVSSSNTVTLTSAAAVNDIIEVVTITNLNSVNTYTQSEITGYLANKKTEVSSAISANTTLVAGRRYFVTSASALTLTLPASPAQNDQVDIFDASGNAATYNITLGRNSSLINGNAGNFIIDANGYWASLVYTGATYGWKVG